MIFPIIGMLISTIAFCGVLGANRALKELKGNWKYIEKENFRRPYGEDSASSLGNIPGKFFPLLLFVIWILMLFYHLTFITHNDTKPAPFPYDTTAANTRLHELERRLQAIEKVNATDTAAPGNRPVKGAGTMK